jgi:hypothetical protein
MRDWSRGYRSPSAPFVTSLSGRRILVAGGGCELIGVTVVS